MVLGRKGISPPEIRSDLSDELLPVHLTEDELARVASIQILFAANIALKFRAADAWGEKDEAKRTVYEHFTDVHSQSPSTSGRRRRRILTAGTIRRN